MTSETIDSDYVRVTEVIEKFMPLPNIPQHILDAAAWRGECVHKMIELFEQNILAEYDQSLESYLDNWIKFKSAYKPEDCIIDIKSGGHYKSHFIQIGAYYLLGCDSKDYGLEKRLYDNYFKFTGRLDIFKGTRKAYLVYLKKYEVIELSQVDLAHYSKIFLSMLDIYKFINDKSS